MAEQAVCGFSNDDAHIRFLCRIVTDDIKSMGAGIMSLSMSLFGKCTAKPVLSDHPFR